MRVRKPKVEYKLALQEKTPRENLDVLLFILVIVDTTAAPALYIVGQ